MTIKYMYCLCLHNELLNVVKKLTYIPVGLGENKFDIEWLRDNTGENISKKNKFYGEHTFHYWFWKNEIDKIKDNEWIGFCAYRRFWVNKNYSENKSIYENSLREIPEEWSDYDTIIGDEMSLTHLKLMKVLKYGKLALLRNPKAILNKGRTIRFHFDMHHGNGIIDRATKLLGPEDKDDFNFYIRNNTSFNKGVMFICKSKSVIKKYYETIFDWLYKCEKEFGFDMKGYGRIRLYAYLAERFLPYWFRKNSKCLEWPIIFYDLKKNET